MRLLSILVLSVAMAMPALAWRGAGTESNPYEIRTTGDWRDLANEVMLGNSQKGVVFRLLEDIVANDQLGLEESAPFEGTIEGDGHTISFSGGYSDAPAEIYDIGLIRYVRNATFHHLVVEGTLHTRSRYAAGFVGHVLGDSTTTFVGCTSNIIVVAHGNLTDAGHGGFVGRSDAGTTLRFDHCTFGGQLLTTRENNNDTHGCGGFVGECHGTVDINWCVFAPQPVQNGEIDEVSTGATFVRLADGATLNASDNCYYTQKLGTVQGIAVFDTIRTKGDCEAVIVSEPTVELGGRSYWQSGAEVRLTTGDDVPFAHYLGTNCTLSDPFAKDGVHVIRDVTDTPTIYVMDSMPEAKDEETVFGIKYRYLSINDYYFYTSEEDRQKRGWYFNDNGYLCVKDAEDTEYYVTAIVGYDASQLQRTIGGQWVWSDTQYEGTAVPVDLVTNFFHHTHLGIIAPRAFEGCNELKRLTFISDIDETQVYHNNLGVDLSIGERAFADCPNLEEIDMMYYNYTGNDHWETVGPAAIHHIADDAFEGSAKCRILVNPTQYQNYLSSDTWETHHSRIGLYMAATEDMKVNGAVYSYMRNANNEAIKNNAAGHEALMQTLRYWNADYQQFLASDLLAEQDKKNIWYTQVTDADTDYLKSHDGVMRIYNDPGSYYNYKTIAIGANAFNGCSDLRAIEFWQTNGRSENSYSDLKVVIQNGAFAHCDSLREVRLYYYCQDGDNHWETLGPKNVIPGDNIFGTLTSYDGVTKEEYLASSFIPAGFRFVVSPERYQEFIDDPNWSKYANLIVAADYEPTDWSPIETDGLVYDYASKTVNTASTNQVVTQNLSWWNLPIKIYEIITLYEAIKDMAGLLSSLKTAFKNFKAEMARNFQSIGKGLENMDMDLKWLNNLDPKAPNLDYMYYKPDAANEWIYPQTKEAQSMIDKGIIEWNQSKRYAFTAKSRELLTNDPVLFEEFRDAFRAGINHYRTTAKAFWDASVKQAIYTLNVATKKAFKKHFLFIDLGIANAYPSFWALGSDISEEQFQRGLVENIKSNIHNLSYENTLIYTPDKKLIYHVYVKKPSVEKDSITIYNDIGRAYNYRTVGIKRDAFQGNKTLRSVAFAENAVAGSDSYVPMLMAIPDSAFAGCSNLERLYLTYKTRNGGVRSLGPENFILGGDSIFAGCDSTKFRIVIDIDRKQDFLDDEVWRGYQRFFTYTDVKPERYDHEYGVNYALYYDNNTTQRVSKISGHKIEHLSAISADDEFLKSNQGSMGLMNDIGTYNNYKLDEVTRRAFKGNKNIRAVSFWDLKGGDAYTQLDMELGDSCFAGCTNMANIDMLYCVTDGDDHIELLRPTQVRAGKGMFDGTNARIKMMPVQVSWFENDSAWAPYRDRFMPCIIQPNDEGVKRALKGMDYYTPCNSPYHWTDYIDLARIGGAGFSWLDGRFREQADRLYSFPDFRYFASVGLDYVGAEWFHGCALLSNILLPETIRRIGGAAFEGCHKLEEIELPAGVEQIGGRAFFDCPLLKKIVVRGSTPAQIESTPFSYNEGMTIYVPAAAVAAYKAAWPDYAQYIVGEDYVVNKHVTTTKKGELAEKLGLYAEISYSGLFYGDELYRLHGNYSKYDSLTVSGPLDDLDLSVLRYLAGRDSYHNKGGDPTDGCLHYLDLSGAQIREGSKYNYVYLGSGSDILRNAISADDEIPRALFYKCGALETLILPRAAKDVRIEAFDAPNLKRIAFTNDGDLQYNHLMGGMGRGTTLLSAPLEELVFLTGKAATSATSKPWGQTIDAVYAYNSQVGDYSGHEDLAQVAHYIAAPMADDAAINALAAHAHYFPSQYMELESVEGIFAGNSTVTDLHDFFKFGKVRELQETFSGCTALERIGLPVSLETIGRDAFAGCTSLDTIYIDRDSVPSLAEDAFEDLPSDFRILVPKSHVNRYRERWQQYADHIMVDDGFYDQDNILTVTVTEPNTLDKALGLEMSYTTHIATEGRLWPTGMKGDYSGIRRLKVIGPISGGDLALLRHLAGFTSWTKSRNFLGHLEYLDLYDADLVASKYEFAQDKYGKPDIFNPGTDLEQHVVSNDNELPRYAFLKCYSLKTLILPRTCTEVDTRAMQECENLETLVIGDNTSKFNWDAIDDCASMVRLYLLSESKLKITSEFAVWRWLCNNYNPTFDAFYVRPSSYNSYVSDDAYTGSSWQRTNNIQTGVFDADEEFCAFAAHAAATAEDLSAVRSVDGWFDRHPGIKDLTALAYTSVDSLKRATLAPLTQLERIALPVTIETIGDSVFADAPRLRYVDMLMCDSTMAVSRLRGDGFAKLGIDSLRTLVYVPQEYGTPDGMNVVVGQGALLKAAAFRLVDSLDYCVPYAFESERVENSRVLSTAGRLYTVCLPYMMDTPAGAKVYQLGGREGSELVFKEVSGNRMDALTPYVLKVMDEDGASLDTEIRQTVPSSVGLRTEDSGRDLNVGYILRGSVRPIDNATAHELGAYILQTDNRWYRTPAGVTEACIPPFRAYLLESAGSMGANALSMRLADDATGIDVIRTIDSDGSQRVYDLQGREVSDSWRGIVIKNGEKYVRK